ncbi:MAG: glucosyl-3-phosphoglycerate synthase [Actinomycetota bacterium]|nr:glucosyl-3-phosphoglycerate synthase [Actinomycetota bacterium]
MLQPVVSVVVPARNEAPTVGAIVEALVAAAPRIAEVVVVDDGSEDDTAAVAGAAGARVVRATSGPGKGQAMRQGLMEATGELIVFCDADLVDFCAAYATDLVDALLAHPQAKLAKARYHRTGTGGRVNELVARPALELLHPGLAHIAQPLGGEYAAWREVFEAVTFVDGYGVDLGLLLDIAERFGIEAIVEVDLGVRTHRNRTLHELRPQAREVLSVALDRANR